MQVPHASTYPAIDTPASTAPSGRSVALPGRRAPAEEAVSSPRRLAGLPPVLVGEASPLVGERPLAADAAPPPPPSE